MGWRFESSQVSVNTYENTSFVIKDFVKEELQNLNSWCLNNYKKSFFKDANMGKPGTRMTTRFSSTSEGLNFPSEAYKIKSKIINRLNLVNYKQPSFHDGIVCGIGFNGGSIYPHIDPVWHKNTYTFHCNLLSNKPLLGGETYINSQLFPVECGDLLCFDVSSQEHMVSEIYGDEPRILWVFGFSIPTNV